MTPIVISGSEGLIMVGAFPPPVQGMAVINQAMAQRLAARDCEPVIVDIAAPSLERGIAYHLTRMCRTFGGLLRLLVTRKSRASSLYMSVSGGYGQVHEAIFAFIARLKGMRATLHHHSYAYLDKPNRLTRLLFALAPHDTWHVVLSAGMAEGLQRNYGVGRIRVLSNAAFMSHADVPARLGRELQTLGFLSNISAEKGIFEFISLVDACVSAGMRVYGVVAGPFQNAETESKVMAMLKDRPKLKYVGPRYGVEKDAFFESIDALIFPTRYVNEAEPITIHEALRSGVPVIAYGRGAIPELIDDSCGMVIAPQKSFVPEALGRIKWWQDHVMEFMAASQTAFQRFARVHAESGEHLENLLIELVGQAGSCEDLVRRRNDASC
jgi:glycosyltransferase involved in cell wall biosynthesis